MGKQTFNLENVRPVRKLNRVGGFQVDTVLEVSANQDAWVEKNMVFALAAERYVPFLQTQRKDELEKKIAQEKTIPVAVAVTDTQKDRPVLVACGEIKLAMNEWIGVLQFSFLHNSLEWLLGKEPAGIAPQKSNRYWLNEPGLNVSRIRYLPAFLMGLAIIGLGAGVWVVRRR
jgi:hypothetical protein